MGDSDEDMNNPANYREIPYEPERHGTMVRKQEQIDAQQAQGFDWEKVWRQRKAMQQMKGSMNSAPVRRRSPPCRRVSRSRERRRRRSNSRDGGDAPRNSRRM